MIRTLLALLGIALLLLTSCKAVPAGKRECYPNKIGPKVYGPYSRPI